ncbi:MAG: hypothetical protein IPH93_14260 [Saprospiraceae bacterium]|nr:hypothetical protein [Saprospiraceae bacterium]
MALSLQFLSNQILQKNSFRNIHILNKMQFQKKIILAVSLTLVSIFNAVSAPNAAPKEDWIETESRLKKSGQMHKSKI